MNGNDAALFVVASLHIEVDGGSDGCIARALGDFFLLDDDLHGLDARLDLVTRLASDGAEDGQDEEEQNENHEDCPDAQACHQPHGGPIDW